MKAIVLNQCMHYNVCPYYLFMYVHGMLYMAHSHNALLCNGAILL
jgi:hypothetical protein